VSALDNLPLYASEDQIARAVLGAGGEKRWKEFASFQENHGLPKIDPFFGRRYVPAVKRFLDRREGLLDAPALTARDGKEDHAAWNTRRSPRRA
jgi:hypothetical protein